jgi:hypothetical protein
MLRVLMIALSGYKLILLRISLYLMKLASDTIRESANTLRRGKDNIFNMAGDTYT